MIGAIVLTLRRREGVRRQKIPQQLARDAKSSIELKKVPLRGGIR
jgi:NADH-quinone oxidoreductase subunit J